MGSKQIMFNSRIEKFTSANIFILNKAVLGHESAEELRRLLGSSLPLRVGHVDPVQAELLGVAHRPLEVVHQRPSVVTLDGDTVQHDGLEHLIDVMLVVVNSAVFKLTLTSFSVRPPPL